MVRSSRGIERIVSHPGGGVGDGDGECGAIVMKWDEERVDEMARGKPTRYDRE